MSQSQACFSSVIAQVFRYIIFHIGTRSVPGCIPTPERHCH